MAGSPTTVSSIDWQVGDRADRLKIVVRGGASTVGCTQLLEAFFATHTESSGGIVSINGTEAVKIHEYDFTDTVTTSGAKPMPQKKVDFWDCSGLDQFAEEVKVYTTCGMDACILVFDGSVEESYTALEGQLKEIRQNSIKSRRPEVPIFIACNKIDLNIDIESKTFAITQKHTLPNIIFTSAKTGRGVKELFQVAMSAASQYRSFAGKVHQNTTDEAAARLTLKVISSKPPAERDPVTVVLLGDSGVGKSKLIERFLKQKFSTSEHKATGAVEKFKYDTVSGDGVEVDVDIVDTPGGDQKLNEESCNNADACILVFNCGSKTTYASLKDWLHVLRDISAHNKGTPVIVACNQYDHGGYDAMSKEFDFAINHNFPLFRVSASSGNNVWQLFDAAIKAGVEHKKAQQAKKKE